MLQSQSDSQSVFCRNYGANESGSIDVTLNEVTSKTCVCIHCTFAVDSITDFEFAEVGLFERFRCDADLEVAALVGFVGVEFGDGETGAVDCDTVSDVTVFENESGSADGNGVASTSRLGGILRRDVDDGSQKLDCKQK